MRLNQSYLTDLGELHKLLRWRHHALRLHFIYEAVGDVGVTVIQQLANDQLIQLLSVFQSRFGTIHLCDPNTFWTTQNNNSFKTHSKSVHAIQPSNEIESSHFWGLIPSQLFTKIIILVILFYYNSDYFSFQCFYLYENVFNGHYKIYCNIHCLNGDQIR